jgi:hypothetical protein
MAPIPSSRSLQAFGSLNGRFKPLRWTAASGWSLMLEILSPTVCVLKYCDDNYWCDPPHLDPFMDEQALDVLAKFIRDTGLTVESINLPSLNWAGNHPLFESRPGGVVCYHRGEHFWRGALRTDGRRCAHLSLRQTLAGWPTESPHTPWNSPSAWQ